MSKVNLKQILNASEALVLDDLNTLTKQHRNTFELFFKKVHYISCDDEAQRVFNGTKIDVIFSELTIGTRSCFDFLANIRQYNKNIPVVILTQNATKELLIDFIPLGIATVNEKPFDVSTLINTLNNIAKLLLNNGLKNIKIDDKLSYDYISKTVIKKSQKVKLTKKESLFLELLLSKQEKVFTSQEIELHIWGEEVVSDSTFKSLLKRLRDKVGKEYIKNNSGVGYYLVGS